MMKTMFSSPFGTLGSFSHFENKVLFQQMLEGVDGVAYFFTGLGQTPLNPSLLLIYSSLVYSQMLQRTKLFRTY